MRFRTFSCRYIPRKRVQGLKKQVIYIFGINVVIFDVVFYSQYVLRLCIIDGYAVKKLRKLQ